VGQGVRARVLAYADRTFDGEITTLGPSVDPTTHRVLIRSEIADPEHLLRSGMFATFVIRVADPVRAVGVPQMALCGKATARSPCGSRVTAAGSRDGR
jgi:membrane fusion protein, heavy metal efflux system